MGLILFLLGSLFAQTMNESLIVGDRADIPTDSVFFVNSKKGSILSRLTEIEKLNLNPSIGMIIYNLDKFQYEQYNGTTWIRLGSGLLENWEAGKNYYVGEIKNSGSDGNWLFKVIKDHVSSYVPTDINNGNLLAISPPIITTGVQDGGEASLVGNIATIEAGTGFIAEYNLSPSPYPLITIVEWPTQTITLPTSGIFALLIDPNGTLISAAGVSQADVTANNIGVAIADMNLGQIFDRKTYPTNPVGQLKSLAYFFGGMTKGLKYSATGLQLGRSGHDVYFWGADFNDPYAPNTKTVDPINPVNFFEFTQNGPVTASSTTTLKNNVYDLNGTLVTMSNNKWGFVRIFSSLGDEDYIMYSQAEYQTEADAKEAAMSGDFIKPPDLTLTKFSAWLVFEKGDADFSNNEIIICEPFGCDKVGSAGGGGTGGVGDVAGPPGSIDSALAAFSGTSGKVLKSSNQLSLGSILVLDKNGASDGQLNIESAIAGSGKYYPNKFIFQNTNLETFTLQAPAITTSYVLSLPLVGPSNDQILKSDSAGQLSWIPIPSGGGSGNVVGPANSTDGEIPVYSATTGKLLGNSNLIYTGALRLDVPKTLRVGVNKGLPEDGVLIIYNKASGGKFAGLMAGNAPTGNSYYLRFPNVQPNANQILQSSAIAGDSTSQLNWINLPASPTPTTVEDNLISNSPTNALSANQGRVLNEKTIENSSAIASNTILITENQNDIDILFSDIAGLQSSSHSHANKTLLDSLISNGSATSFLSADGTYKVPVDTNTITTVENVLTSVSTTNALSAAQGKVLNDKITPLQTSSHAHANKTLLDSLISNGSATQFLSADGTYKTPVDNVGGTGDVIGPGSSTDNAIVRFDLTTGKLIKNSGVTIDGSNNIYTPGTISSVGQIWSIGYLDADLSFDFNLGNNQYTNLGCGSVNLSNMQDGGIYTIGIKGGSGTCSFAHNPVLTMHLPPGHGAVVAGKHSVYTLIRMGGDVYIYWVTGL